MSERKHMEWSNAAQWEFIWIGVGEILFILAGLYGPGLLRMVAIFLLLGLLLRSLFSVWTLGFVQAKNMRAEVRFRTPIYLMGGIAMVGLITILSRST